jgi:O-antigen/teichoic acid export membrane protein
VIKKLIQSKFARNVGIMLIGISGAQAINLAFAPLITRIYAPEMFGLLGVFTSLIGILTPIVSLAYPIAIVLPKEDSDAEGIVELSFWLAIIISTITAFILFFLGEALLKLINAESIAAYVMLIPLAAFFYTMLQINEQWLIRKKQFKIISKISFMQALIINSVKTSLGWLNPTASVLIIITVSGTALHAAMMALGIKRNTNSQAKINIDYTAKNKKQLAQDYIDFPIYRAPQWFIMTVSESLIILMLASFFGPDFSGFYVLSRLALTAPSAIIGKSFSHVFSSRINEAAHKKENLTRLIIKATLELAAVGFVLFAIVIAFGPWLFSFIFGAKWVVAGEYARWLALWAYFGFVNIPSVLSVPVLVLQAQLLIIELFSVAGCLVALLIGFYYFESDVLSVALVSIFGVARNILLIIYVILNSKKKK